MPAKIDRSLTSIEIERRVREYFLAVEPLAKMMVNIISTQPHYMLIRDDGTFETVSKEGWSDDAKQMYTELEKEVVRLKSLYFDKDISGVIYPVI